MRNESSLILKVSSKRALYSNLKCLVSNTAATKTHRERFCLLGLFVIMEVEVQLKAIEK